MSTAVRYQDTLKPAQVETPLDMWFFRPAAWGLVRLALPTPLSANGMTLLSIVCGLAASGMFLAPDERIVAAGSLLMVLYGVLDCADGQLARARGTASRIGRILDGVSDYVVGAASGLAITWTIWTALGPRGLALALAGLTSVVVQGTLFDYFKNRYLRLSGSRFREGDDLEETRAELDALRVGRGPLWQRALLWVYATFLALQRTGAREAPRRDEAPPEQRAAFAAKLAPVARGWAWLGPSTHVLLLAGFTLARALPWYVVLRLTAGNVLMAGLLLWQRRRERAVLA